jgi:acetyl-CoA acetyltransferase
MTSSRSAVFANPVRTAIGTFGGSLKEVPAPNLGAAVIKAALERAGLKPDEAGTVAMGNVIQIQDQCAFRSQRRFAVAQAAGRFKDEIVTIDVPGRNGAITFDTDEHNRPKTTLEVLAALKPAFRSVGLLPCASAGAKASLSPSK